MSYWKTTMYNQRSCPQTPAPPKNGPRFPMSAAILETPSIMSSLREPEEKNRPPNMVEPPPPKQFVMSYPSNVSFRSPNDSMAFADHQGSSSRQNINTTQSLNSSFLDCSFSSSISTPSSSMKRKVPLANSTISNTNSSRKSVSFSSKMSVTSGLKSFHRSGVPASLNDSLHLHTSGTTAHEKQKLPTERGGVTKYIKLTSANIPSDVPASVQDSKTSLRIVSGTIEHLQKTIREQGRLPLLLETVANVVSIKPGTRMKEKVILLRHRNQGPVMQGVYYEIDLDLPHLVAGDLVRCVGRLQSVGSRLQILKIARTTEQYNRAILRLQTVSAFTTKVRR
ncbi:uncharacterized protein LOC126567427 [Anopheles maculipalpis]|uniref:uncharacterized protein LOC126567427 n=1 Tax=Anopheles maculipalpis TaxID=1496333 RepID=UPI002158C634|nr:uncharacterized protein LOC126567427 [Anopheles maculipalpis]